MTDEIKPGTKVGAERWAYRAAHPGCWLKPWSGVVLDRDDPRAWEGSIAFPSKRPNREAVRAHVAEHPSLLQKVPVLWNFGGEKRVFWESAANVRPYAEDVAAWKAARDAAFAREKA